MLTTASTTLAASPDQWVYVGTYTGGKSKGIYVSRLDATGKLSQPRLVATLTNPSFLALGPKHRYLYAISDVNDATGKRCGEVAAFSCDAASGQLTKLNEQLSGGEPLCHVQVDATGKTVLVASYGGGSVATLPVKADGSLGKATAFIQHHGSSVNPVNQKGPHAHCFVTDPANRFALACDLGLDQVAIYRLDPTSATLVGNDPACAKLTPGLGPRHLAFRPDGKFAYVINEMGCIVTAFAYDADRGALAEIQTVSALPAGRSVDPTLSGAEIVAHPSGKFVYGSTRGIDQLNVFTVDRDSGKLALVQSISSGSKTPRNFNVDPTGQFLLAANQNSDNVAVFRIDSATGHLTATGQTIEIGNPGCVAFGPAN